MKSGNLNFLEPSGPLQACNGTAFPLPYLTDVYVSVVDVLRVRVSCETRNGELCILLCNMDL